MFITDTHLVTSPGALISLSRDVKTTARDISRSATLRDISTHATDSGYQDNTPGPAPVPTEPPTPEQGSYRNVTLLLKTSAY